MRCVHKYVSKSNLQKTKSFDFQIEIEEYRDYNKALEALMEAYKTLRDNGDNTFSKDEGLQELELKCRNIKRFIDARE